MDNDIYKDVQQDMSQWVAFIDEQLNKVYGQRDFIYNSDTARSEVDVDRVVQTYTSNAIRAAVNRVKTDAREIHPNLTLTPHVQGFNPESRQVYQSLLNKCMEKNFTVFNSCFDDIVDLSMCAIVWTMSNNDNYEPSMGFNRIEDLRSIYSDSSCSLEQVNTQAKFMGRIQYLENKPYNDKVFKKYKINVNENDGPLKVIDHYRKVVIKTITMGRRHSDVGPSGYLTEEAVRGSGVEYINKYKKKLNGIRHLRFVGEQLILDEVRNIDVFPIIIGCGSIIENVQSGDSLASGKRLVLAPFADSAIDAQKSLDLARTLAMRNIRLSRGGGKLAYTAEMIKGYEDNYKNRANSNADLAYNFILDSNGNPIPGVMPTPVPDAMPSPLINEALSHYPEAIQGALGNNPEQYLSKNMSGEAIANIQQISSKSSKIYMDKWLVFLGHVGGVIKGLYQEYFMSPMDVHTKNGHTHTTIKVNHRLPHGLIKHDIAKLKDYTTAVKLGPSPALAKQKTQRSLMQLYQTVPEEVRGAIIKSTLPLYIASMDTPEADLIAKMVSGALSQLEQQQQQSAQVEQQGKQKAEQLQMAQFQQGMQAGQTNIEATKGKMQIDLGKLQIDQGKLEVSQHQLVNTMSTDHDKNKVDKTEAEAKMITADSNMKKANNEIATTTLKANAEIIKATADASKHVEGVIV